VSFYAVAPGAEEQLRRNLSSFSSELPGAVHVLAEDADH
jgi:hypothetical protein